MYKVLMKRLTLHALVGYYYIASLDGGKKFKLKYSELDDWCYANNVKNVINKAEA